MIKNSYIYGFVLGRVSELSRAEIISLLQQTTKKSKDLYACKDILILEFNDLLNVNGWQRRLGGTIKIFQIMSECSEKDLKSQLTNILNQRLKDIKPGEEKFQFGFSLYGNLAKDKFKKIGLSLKKEFKNSGFKVRFVDAKTPDLSSVIVTKEKLIAKGADIVVVKNEQFQRYFLGLTLSVQDFEDFAQRDYGRPTRDDRSGMLPPKLARMMINLSQSKIDEVIL